MSISGYSQTLVDVTLGWLKGLANWVLRLFNLAGSGVSPLLWLSQNWLKLLIIFLIIGVSLDVLIWLVRWRPYWVWFRKKRIIVNDKFLAEDNLDDGASRAKTGSLDENWQERDYLVASDASRRRRQNEEERAAPRGHASSDRPMRRGTRSMRPVARPAHRGAQPMDLRDPRGRKRPVKEPGVSRRQRALDQDLFGVDTNQPDASDFYEDEVFNVSNLPPSSAYEDDYSHDDVFDVSDLPRGDGDENH